LIAQGAQTRYRWKASPVGKRFPQLLPPLNASQTMASSSDLQPFERWVARLEEDATAAPLFPVAGAPATRVFRATISPDWFLGNAPEGGYVFAIALAAARRIVSDACPDPVTASAQFLARADGGPCMVEVALLRRGAQYATVQATLVQRSTRCVLLLATFADSARRTGPTRVVGAPPDVLPLAKCVPVTPGDPAHGFVLAFHHRLQLRLDPRDMPPLPDSPAIRRALVRGHVRLAASGDAPLDLVSIGMLADSFRPPVISYGSEVVGLSWFPTLELTVQFRRPPQVHHTSDAALGSGWLAFVFETRYLMDGLHEVDAQLWDESGQLVALGRYLHCSILSGEFGPELIAMSSSRRGRGMRVGKRPRWCRGSATSSARTISCEARVNSSVSADWGRAPALLCPVCTASCIYRKCTADFWRLACTALVHRGRIGRPGLLDPVEVLHDHVIQNRDVVAQVRRAQPEVGQLLLVELRDRVLVVNHVRVLDALGQANPKSGGASIEKMNTRVGARSRRRQVAVPWWRAWRAPCSTWRCCPTLRTRCPRRGPARRSCPPARSRGRSIGRTPAVSFCSWHSVFL